MHDEISALRLTREALRPLRDVESFEVVEDEEVAED